MARFQRLAAGLRGLLDQVGAGNTPQEIAEFVQPTLDVRDFLATSKGKKAQTATSALAAIGSTITITVPEGELWLVESASANLSFGALNQKFLLVLRYDGVPVLGGGGLTQEIHRQETIQTANAGESDMIAWFPPQPFFAKSGESFVLRVAADLGTGFVSVTSTFQVVFTLLATGPGQVTAFR